MSSDSDKKSSNKKCSCGENCGCDNCCDNNKDDDVQTLYFDEIFDDCHCLVHPKGDK